MFNEKVFHKSHEKFENLETELVLLFKSLAQEVKVDHEHFPYIVNNFLFVLFTQAFHPNEISWLKLKHLLIHLY